jgi:hypothetical protein
MGKGQTDEEVASGHLGLGARARAARAGRMQLAWSLDSTTTRSLALDGISSAANSAQIYAHLRVFPRLFSLFFSQK